MASNGASDYENDSNKSPSAKNDPNKSPSAKKMKKKCDYRKGRKQAKYSLLDKAKVIELIEKGMKTYDIVRMTIREYNKKN